MVSQVLAIGPGRELIDQAFTDQMHNERRLLNLLTPTETATLETLLTTWLSRMAQAAPAATESQRATDLLREAVLADRELFDEVVMPLVNRELWREIIYVSGLFRRNPAFGAQPLPLPSEDPRLRGDARGVALKGERIAGIILTMDRITLPSGVRLGDATDDDLLAAIAHHRRLIAGSERAIRFYEAVLDAKRSARGGADTSHMPVREVLVDTLVARLHQRYYGEQPGG